MSKHAINYINYFSLMSMLLILNPNCSIQESFLYVGKCVTEKEAESVSVRRKVKVKCVKVSELFTCMMRTPSSSIEPNNSLLCVNEDDPCVCFDSCVSI